MSTNRALIQKCWQRIRSCTDLMEAVELTEQFTGESGKWDILVTTDKSGQVIAMVHHDYYDDVLECFDYEEEPLRLVEEEV